MLSVGSEFVHFKLNKERALVVLTHKLYSGKSGILEAQDPGEGLPHENQQLSLNA